MTKHYTKTKSGAVSFYIVIFLTLIFGVITLSFVRIVINEANESSNTDLYNSAYDSALAGIEDAKIALIKYHDCISQGAVANAAAAQNTCPRIVYDMEDAIAKNSCDVVQRVLARDQEGVDDAAANPDGQRDVIVQETQSITSDGNASEMEQAYTCVKITEENDDYLTTLDASSDTRIIPLHSADLQAARAIEIKWYSAANGTSYNFMGDGNMILQRNRSNSYTPPVLAVDLFQSDTNGDGVCGGGYDSLTPCFSVGELSVNNNNSSGTDHAVLLFRPKSGNDRNFISAATVLDHSDKHDNGPISVQCNSNGDYACTATIEIPPTFRNTTPATATSFLKIASPYGRPDADVSVRLCTGIENNACNGYTKLTGVQAAIDSTGRANDLYRRVEVRVELVDLYYPYPEAAVFLNGEDATDKNFFVTRNCRAADNGAPRGCDNSGDV
ncbi:hypothetical protein IJG78_00220 [Candidatus Saccharibacteria bacterium]|nr:hypothetical protein [Candidatus Saccharibacteria bacterium]